MTKVFSKRILQGGCPNPKCPYHDPLVIQPGEKWYRNHGYYNSEQHGKVPRYVCNLCNRTFSLRTCDSEWYLHNDTIDTSQVGSAWLAGGSLTEIAKEKGITVSMVRTRLKRFLQYYEFSDF